MCHLEEQITLFCSYCSHTTQLYRGTYRKSTLFWLHIAYHKTSKVFNVQSCQPVIKHTVYRLVCRLNYSVNCIIKDTYEIYIQDTQTLDQTVVSELFTETTIKWVSSILSIQIMHFSPTFFVANLLQFWNCPSIPKLNWPYVW